MEYTIHRTVLFWSNFFSGYIFIRENCLEIAKILITGIMNEGRVIRMGILSHLSIRERGASLGAKSLVQVLKLFSIFLSLHTMVTET